MENIIGLKDLRQNMENYIRKIKKGEEFVVVKKSSPVFKIVPLDFEDEGDWEEVIDFTKIKKGGVSVSEVLEKLKKL
ncbi:type II toxin-antitoxin system prevent-host-death family antitoxin [bacterium]|jgi:prevent-host-death family protein|nr:type II toxin-antitoxin system prevent-host-death family antitoxin [bacterium]MBT4495138.1 type II toxin-antitoxin system prevent-host-death family antitoxin [bacterium]MBT4764378.1 type II toxin-antitoxin system prevent-host-death family antitoxin [bacterium]MBT5401749.1 type II toxin-antitoxin system prevent-host-death family antitoxin [bacterium]